MHVRHADLAAHPIPVVLVDHAERDLAAVDLVGDRLVVRIDVAAGVRLDAVQPRLGRRFAVGAEHGGHDRLEVGLACRKGELALLSGIGEPEHRGLEDAALLIKFGL